MIKLQSVVRIYVFSYDTVVVIFPLTGSMLHAKFHGGSWKLECEIEVSIIKRVFLDVVLGLCLLQLKKP